MKMFFLLLTLCASSSLCSLAFNKPLEIEQASAARVEVHTSDGSCNLAGSIVQFLVDKCLVKYLDERFVIDLSCQELKALEPCLSSLAKMSEHSCDEKEHIQNMREYLSLLKGKGMVACLTGSKKLDISMLNDLVEWAARSLNTCVDSHYNDLDQVRLELQDGGVITLVRNINSSRVLRSNLIDTGINSVLPIGRCSLEEWYFIEKQLQRIDTLRKKKAGQAQEKSELYAAITSLDGAKYADFLYTVNYLDMPELLSIMSNNYDVGKMSETDIFSLPLDLYRYLIIKYAQKLFDIVKLTSPIVVCGNLNHSMCASKDRIVSLEGKVTFCDNSGLDTDLRLATEWQMDIGDKLRVWDQVTGKELFMCVRGLEGLSKVAVSEESIIIGKNDGSIHIRDLKTGLGRELPRRHRGKILSLAVYGNQFISTATDGTARLWSIETGEQLALCAGHTHYVCEADVSGDTIVTGSYDRTVRVWDRQTGKPLKVFPVKAMIRHVCIADKSIFALFSPTYERPASEGNVYRWNLETGEEGMICKGDLVDYMRVAGDRLVTVSKNTMRIWNHITNKLVAVCTGHTKDISAFDVSHNKIVSFSSDGIVKIWSLYTGNELAQGTAYSCRGAQIYLRGDRIVARSWAKKGALFDTKILIWDISFLNTLKNLDSIQARALFKFMQEKRKHRIDSYECWENIVALLKQPHVVDETPVKTASGHTKRCLACKKDGQLKRCGTCKKVYFCNADCQKKIWKAHKPNCVESDNLQEKKSSKSEKEAEGG